jgi:hypothetical protein
MAIKMPVKKTDERAVEQFIKGGNITTTPKAKSAKVSVLLKLPRELLEAIDAERTKSFPIENRSNWIVKALAKAVGMS